MHVVLTSPSLFEDPYHINDIILTQFSSYSKVKFMEIL